MLMRMFVMGVPLASLLLITGCARPLAPVLVKPDAASCGAQYDQCLELGKQQFAAYRQAKLELIQQRSQGYRLPGAPTAWLHPYRTEYAMLLIHGLNDSAYYMADIAEIFYRQGYNVLTVLLPGHGTDTRDMLEVSAEQWRAEVEQGLAMTQLVGRKLIVGGFSLGGALAIDAALRRADIHGLILFSPAVKLHYFNGLSGLSCVPGLADISVETELPENPVKYKYRVANGVCQLARLIESNLADGEAKNQEPLTFEQRLRAMAQRIRVPTFIALTFNDARISPEAVIDFAGEIKAPVLITTFGKEPVATPSALPNGGTVDHIDDQNLDHSYLIRRTNPYNGQQNPHFDAMAKVLVRFVSQHFPLMQTGAAPVSQ
jgi:alpha-beta hydrolase superfamily lysophospholipase